MCLKEYKKVIYVSHAYGGQPENKQEVEEIIGRLIKKYPDCLFISPINTFGFLYYDVPYEDGLDMTLALLKKCTHMLVTGDNWGKSKGVKREIKFCIINKIPFTFCDENGEMIGY